jgi:hypothetical protein
MVPRASLSVILMVVALLAVPMSLAIEAAIAGAGSNPAQYRYAGVVEDARGIPTHTITRGGGIVFSFFDALSLGRKSETYQLCVGRPGKAASRCWKKTARYGVGKVTFSAVLPPAVPLGELTARWLIAGRPVALWAFLYVRAP